MKVLLILLLFSNSAFCVERCSVGTALSSLREGAQFVIYDDKYSTIQWKNSVTPPTLKEVETEITACISRYALEKQAKERALVDVKDSSLTDRQKLEALIKYLGL